MKASLVALGALAMAGGVGVGVAFAAGSGTSHAQGAPTVHASTQGPPTTVASATTPTTAPAPAPAPTTTTAPAAAAPAWAASSSDNSVSGHDGTLSATLTASTAKGEAGTPVTFTVTVSDTAATGAVGLQWIRYGDDSTTPVSGLPAHCAAGATPTPAASTSDFQHTFGAPGTYTVSILVQAPCSAQQVTLSLPIAVS